MKWVVTRDLPHLVWVLLVKSSIVKVLCTWIIGGLSSVKLLVHMQMLLHKKEKVSKMEYWLLGCCSRQKQMVTWVYVNGFIGINWSQLLDLYVVVGFVLVLLILWWAFKTCRGRKNVIVVGFSHGWSSLLAICKCKTQCLWKATLLKKFFQNNRRPLVSSSVICSFAKDVVHVVVKKPQESTKKKKKKKPQEA